MSDQDDEAAIRAVVAGRNAALLDGDMAGVVAPLADDAVVYDLQPPLAFEGAAARDIEGLSAWIATWRTPPLIALDAPVIAVDGDLAVAHGLSHMTGSKLARSPEGDDVDLWYRSTIVLRRRDAQWRIVHEHQSVPFLMDGSFKAAINLQP